ncbi:MAG: glycosyltransferase family 2 protein [Magnetococcus sp. WYHC-3]
MVDVVIPTFNEETRIAELLERLRRACPQARLIFVDNASTDRTVEILTAAGEQVIRHERNLGYGRSLRDGIAAGVGDLVATIDADLEYPPECLPDLLAGLKTHAIVYGSRLEPGTPVFQGLRAAGNRLLTRLFNLLYGQHLGDLYTGVKAFRRSAVEDVSFHRDGFVFVLEFASKLARQGHDFGNVPIDYEPRRSGSSKMRHVTETAKALFFMIYYRLIPLTFCRR